MGSLGREDCVGDWVELEGRELSMENQTGEAKQGTANAHGLAVASSSQQNRQPAVNQAVPPMQVANLAHLQQQMPLIPGQAAGASGVDPAQLAKIQAAQRAQASPQSALSQELRAMGGSANGPSAGSTNPPGKPSKLKINGTKRVRIPFFPSLPCFLREFRAIR